ncbi:MAG: Mu-like prophage major head subunit gpT family protein [Rhodobacterales bacterium]|nr:Mu-like prophage major head subunit gpT family protein [Rhodobacterales bacterium]
MLINENALDLVYKGFQAKYRDSYDKAPTFADKIAMTMQSAGRDETYSWFGNLPTLREWIGPRVVQNISASTFTILNRKFENTIGVAREDIADDWLGVFAPMFAEMGLLAKQHKDELVFSLLAAGFTTNGYDGTPFFGTTHPVLDRDGVTIVTVSNSGGGAGTGWYLMDTTRAVRPIVWQEREGYEFQTQDRSSDEMVFNNDIYLYGVRARVNAGFGLWQLAYGSRQTLNVANYAAARAAMRAFRADGGRPLGVIPTVLVVPPALEAAGLEILNSEYATGGASNPWARTAELIVAPYLLP